MHTKEPWGISIAQLGKEWLQGRLTEAVMGENGEMVAICSENQENAKRIVACVNFCVNVSNETLIKLTGEEFARSYTGSAEQYLKMRQQRDKLLEGLREIFNDIATATDPRYIDVLGKMQKLISEIEENK